jgi:hypothetical protein
MVILEGLDFNLVQILEYLISVVSDITDTDTTYWTKNVNEILYRSSLCLAREKNN